jgi:phenylacetate-CoA ligase
MNSFQPQLAFEPLSVQDEFSFAAMRQTLDYLLAQSPFYQKKLKGHFSESSEIRNWSELNRLPFTTKEELQMQNWDFLCVPKEKIREYTASSGTMGKPVTIALTESDLQRLAYNEEQSFRCADGTSEDLYQLALTLDRQFMAGMAYYSGIQALGASVVRTGPGLPEMQWETIQRLGVNALVAVPSFLLHMADWAKTRGLSLADLTPRKAICIGEHIRLDDFSLSPLGQKLTELWPLKLYGTYAATEMQTAFTECAAGRGGHHQADLIFIEILDDEGKPLPEGIPGEVVITTLGVEGMPLLRYRTGDIAALHAEPCSCGRFSRRLGPVVGRKGQMIKYRGTTLYPPAVYDLLNEINFITDYAVEVYTGSLGTDEVRLHLHTEISIDECDRRLRSLMQARLRVMPQLQFHSIASLQDLLMPPGSRKLRRFIDNR